MAPFKYIAYCLAHAVWRIMISVFECSATVTNNLIIISGDDDLLSITVHHKVSVMRYDNNLPVLFYFSEERYQTVTNGAIVIHTQRLKSDPGGNLLS